MNVFNLSPLGEWLFSDGKRRAIGAACLVVCCCITSLLGYSSEYYVEENATPQSIPFTYCLESGDSTLIDIEQLYQYIGMPDFRINQIGGPVHGQAEILSGGQQIKYIATNGNFTADSFYFELCDELNDCDRNWITIFYIPKNKVATSCDYGSAFVNQPIRGNVLYNDFNYDYRSLEVSTSFLIEPQHGEVILHENGEYLYIPDKNYVGEDQFSYLACTSGKPRFCEKNNVFLYIESNETNCENLISAFTDCLEIYPNESAQIRVIANDKNLTTQGLNVQTSLILEPKYGKASIDIHGNFTYEHLGSIFHEDHARYAICLENNFCQICDTGLIEIKIEDAIHPCQDMRASLLDDILHCCKGHSIVGNIFRNDVDYNKNVVSARVDLSTLPQNGSIKEGSDGNFIYTPDPGFCGTDNFGYIVCFSNGDCDRTTVHMEIYDKQTPVIKDDSYDVKSTSCQNLYLDENDQYLDGFDWSSFRILDGGDSGDFSTFSRGVEFCPKANFSGQDTVTYVIRAHQTPCQRGVLDTGVLILRILPFLHLSHDYRLTASRVDQHILIEWNCIDQPEREKILGLERKSNLETMEIGWPRLSECSFLDQKIKPNHTYLYRLRIGRDNDVYHTSWVAISSDNQTKEVRLWSNDGWLCSDQNLNEVRIYDITGNLLLERPALTECIDATKWSRGVKVIQYQYGHKTQSKTLYF